MTSIDPPVAVPLDVPNLDEARRVLDQLSGTIALFKIGLELFCAEGPRAVAMVSDIGAQAFLDLKLHDIPNTVAGAVRSAARMGISFLTVHTGGGRDMLRAAVETAREHGGPRLLAVTVLTSLGSGDLHELGVADSPRAQVQRLAHLAAEEGTDGVVCSPRELDVLRPALPDLLLCTPGVRPSGSPPDDQRRTLTPAEAILGGADLLVVGRPILRSDDPAGAAAAIVAEVRLASAQLASPRPAAVVTSVHEPEELA